MDPDQPLPATEIEIDLPTTPSRPALAPGASIGRYVVLERIGQGGMGVVYAAYDPQLDRKVAVKLVATTDDRAGVRLLREAQALAQLQHPHVVAVHDVGRFGDDVFLAMEFVEGETLAEHLTPATGARPDWREIVRLFLDAGRGLVAAHDAGLVHRDFKASNVLVGRDGRVRVLDFGLARPAASPAEPEPEPEPEPRLLDERLTRIGSRAGTLAYMSPEQLVGADADRRSDQFSFCTALYEALCDGAAPFEGEDHPSLLEAIRRGALRRPPAESPVPAGVFVLLERGLAASPDDRHPDLRILLDDLARLSLRRRATDRAAEAPDPPILARSRARLGRALVDAGQPREAVRHLEQALAGLTAAGESPRLARCRFDLVRALLAIPPDAESEARRARAADLVAELRRQPATPAALLAAVDAWESGRA